MKHFSKYSVLAAAFIMIMGAALVTNFGPSGKVSKASDFPLEDKLGELINSQNQLTDALTKALGEGNGVDQPKPQNYVAGPNSPAPQCYNDYQTWNTSTTYKQSPWDVTFAVFLHAGTNMIRDGHNLFIDLNGDGLPDYLYWGQENNVAPYGQNACVYLNTGSGWNRVYKCVEVQTGNPATWTFYGDCAQ